VCSDLPSKVELMQRVFHVPSHLSYVTKLASPTFQPVPSPSGQPLRLADLLELDCWDFFDALHLHTVELATKDNLAELIQRLRSTGTRLVFTVHDLVPNIETDQVEFEEKTALACSHASSVVTLTGTAALEIAARYGKTATVIPHGFAVPPELIGRPMSKRPGFLVFGALRPNRNLIGLVRSWRLLDATRPPLRILLRSLGSADKQRYADELAELDALAITEPDLVVSTSAGVLSHEELVNWCREAHALVMPYRSITHSGQLELARDLGLSAVVPDVPTVRAQITETTGNENAHIWFPAEAVDDVRAFSSYLEKAAKKFDAKASTSDDIAYCRTREHREVLNRYRVEYEPGCERR
jgi:glycosyltransferase involved in cell wall biosynthesis